MRRKRLIIIVLLAFIFLAPHVAAKGNTLVFSQEKYIRNDQYNATFEYRSTELVGCSFAYAELTELTQVEAEGLARIIETDVRLFHDKLIGADLQEPIVYAVLQTVRTGPYAVGQAVFCTPEDIRSGEYRHALMQGMLGSEKAWVVEGCLAYTFDVTYDNAVIKTYVNKNGGVIIGLWDTRFYKALNTLEQLSMARQMAHSLVVDLIQYHGIASLTGSIPDTWQAEWCERLELSTRYDPEKAKRLNSLSLYWDSRYDVIAESENSAYFFNVGDAGLKNADIVEDFLYRGEYGRAYILEYMHGRVSNANELWMRDNLTKVNCIVYEEMAGKIGKSAGKTIYISNIIAYQHEQTHILLSTGMKPLSIITEGIAEYFELMLYPYSYRRDSIRYALMETNRKNAWCVGYDAYCQYGGKLTKADFDMRLYINALARYTFEHPGSPSSIPIIGTPIKDIIHYAGLSEEGIEFSYMQGCSLVGYLIDQYGLDVVLNCIRLGTPFEDAFGKPATQVIDCWKATLFND